MKRTFSASIVILIFAMGASAQDIVFESDWGTATGTGNDALLDSDQDVPWTVVGDSSDPNIRVVAAADVDLINSDASLAEQGWPTTNALESTYTGTTSGVVHADRLWPEIQVGEYLYLRWYWVHDGDDALGGGSNGSPHSPQFGPAGICPSLWSHNFGNLYAGTPDRYSEAGYPEGKFHVMWQNIDGDVAAKFDLGSLGDGNPIRTHPAGSIGLDKGAVYRFELRIHRVEMNVLTWGARVYDAAGTLLHTGEDFVERFGGGTLNDESPPALAYTPEMDEQDCLTSILVGVGGQGNIPPGVRTYTGAFAVAISTTANDWIGGYGEPVSPTPDAGVDAGVDAGLDASALDASALDAAAADGAAADASSGGDEGSGCGCRTNSATGASFLPLLLVLTARKRRAG